MFRCRNVQGRGFVLLLMSRRYRSFGGYYDQNLLGSTLAKHLLTSFVPCVYVNFYVVLLCCLFLPVLLVLLSLLYCWCVGTQNYVAVVAVLFVIRFIDALLCRTCLTHANLLIAVSRMANFGLVSFDIFDSLTTCLLGLAFCFHFSLM